jgi:hypothetical protein
MANNKFRSGRERDPIAELAQLIAEADPYGERAAPDNRFRRETASEGHDEAPGVPPAPQLPADVRAPEQAHELDEYRHDDEAYDADNPPYGSHEDYQTEVPSVRRKAPELRLEPAAPTVPKDDRHGFAEFYQVYPRHVARGAAERAYRRIVKNGEATEADLLAGAMRYAAAQDGKDPTYTKHPATWLNGKCWLDEPAPASARPRSYLDSIRAGLAVHLDEEGA